MAIEKIVNLRVDTGNSDATVKTTTDTIVKLKEQIVILEAELLKLEAESGLESVAQDATALQDVAAQPIKLDVQTDKAAIDALVASMGDAEAQAEVLDSLKPSVDITTNASDISKEIKSIDTDVPTIGVDVELEDTSEVEDFIEDIDGAKPKITIETNADEVIPKLEEVDETIKGLTFEQQVELAIDASRAAVTIQEVRAAQKDLQSLLLQTSDTGSETFAKLAGAAGESRDKVNDVNQAINSLSRSPIENLAGGFKGVKTALLDLNFVEFSKQVNLLGVASKKVSFKELASSVGETGKSFLSLGKIILANPIGLIATIITLIVTNFDTLKSAIEKLFPPFKIMEVLVKNIIGVFQDLGDALGLTSFAADKASQAALDAAEKNLKEVEKLGKQQVALAKARGEDTTKIEEENAKDLMAIRQRSISEFNAIVARGGVLTDDQIKQRQDEIDANEELGRSLELLAQKRSLDAEALVKAISSAGKSPAEVARENAEEQKKINKESIDDAIATERQKVDIAKAAIEDAKKFETTLAASTDKDDQEFLLKQKTIAEQSVKIVEESTQKISVLETGLSKLNEEEDKKVTKIFVEENKKRLEEAKKFNEERLKLIQTQANEQFLDGAAIKLAESKKSLQFDTIESAKLLLQVNTELLKREEQALLKQVSLGKITIDDFNSAKAAAKERYDEENKAAQRTIELRKQLGEIEVDLGLDNATFDAELGKIQTKIDELTNEGIMLDATIELGGGTEEVLARQRQVNAELEKEQDRFDAVSLQKTIVNLEAKTKILENEAAKQRDILSRGLNADGSVMSDEERQAIADRLAAIDLQVEKNKEVIKSYEEIVAVVQKGAEAVVSGVDQSIIAEVKRIQKLKEEGKVLSELEMQFLELNKNAVIDIKIKTQTDLVSQLKSNLDRLQAAFDALDPSFITPKDLADMKKQLDKAKAEFLKADADLRGSIKQKNKTEGTTFAQSLGLTEDQTKAIKDAALNATLDTIATISSAALKAQSEANDKRLEQTLDIIEETYNAEIDGINTQLEQGRITEARAKKLKDDARKKQEAEELKAKKKAFEENKKIQKKEAAISFALQVVRLLAAAASLGNPVAIALVGAAMVAAAAIAYDEQVSAIDSQTFRDGGQIDASDKKDTGKPKAKGLVRGPSHEGGGVKHSVLSNPQMVAELEGGEWIVPKSIVAQTPIERLRDLNSGRLKLFEGGGFVDVQANSTVNAAGANIVMPQAVQKGESPIGFAQKDTQIVMPIPTLKRMQDEMARVQKRVTFRS